MQSVAIGWYLYDRTGDAMALAYAGLAVFLPIALFSLPGGDVADRVDRRWILGTAHLAQAAGSAILVLVVVSEATRTWPFYAVLTLAGTARAFSGPAVQSFLPFLVPRERFPAAVAWSSSAQQSATVLGPAVGGLIYLAGAPASFAACSVASLAVATCWFSIRARGGVAQAVGVAAVSRLLEGLRYLRVNRVLLGAISLDLFAVLLGSITALLPIYARDVLDVGPDGLGLMRSSVAVGAVAMGLALAQLPAARQAHAGRSLFLGVAVFGLAALAFAVSKTLFFSLGMLALMGAADMMSVFVRSTLIQLRVPPAMLGRISSVNQIFIGSSNEIGAFESGVAARLLGAVPSVVMGGLITIGIVGATTIWAPELRKLGAIEEA
jgi:MFS family permease